MRVLLGETKENNILTHEVRYFPPKQINTRNMKHKGMKHKGQYSKKKKNKGREYLI